MSNINIKNNTSAQISVSINHWDTDSQRTPVNDSYYSLAPGSNDTWSRADPRGYIISIKKDDTTLSYFVLANTNVVIEEDRVTKVTENAYVINPVE
ncbi:hypothetical protein [Photorhabdus luminescens]|uniref:Uncharacterized protein n=1 Tax=Photorhabdus luminescens subsp. mexicana TaxID=2100167 RepID=A0A4R4IWN8_PHOLU|nr:hypothetical protein [Photorhabdus luminescens]TDB45344.1 hypothetical protein C5468_21485 [Photorhabdus luminescens subsp. mexicana]